MSFPLPDIQTFDIQSVGGTDNILLSDLHELYLITGNVTLSSGYSIGFTGTPVVGVILQILYNATIDLAVSNSINILGRLLNQEEARSTCLVIATWDGSSWNVVLSKTNNNDQKGIYAYTLTSSTSVTLDAQYTNKTIVITGSPSLSGNIAITANNAVNGQEFKIYYLATPTTNGNTITIFGKTLSDYVASNGKAFLIVTNNSGPWVTSLLRDISSGSKIQVSEVSDDVDTQSINLEVSFDIPGMYRVYPYTGFKITTVNYIVTKTLSGTDDGTIHFGIIPSVGATTPDIITIPASTAQGTSGVLNITATNVGLSTDYITILTAKTTVNGRVFLSIKLTKV